jgi:uncharacterized protein (DUF2249 family)/quercetin dioxygenase-like cupin family protein
MGSMSTPDLDIRTLREPERTRAVLQAYDALEAGESFVLVDDHDPRDLRDEFAAAHPGSHGWSPLDHGPEAWRVRIDKPTAVSSPRILCDTTSTATGSDAGVAWSLSPRHRDLDSNIIRLRPGAGIEAHDGPDLDVLILALAGTGRVVTETQPLELRPGILVWLPRRSRHGFVAGPDGLSYLTVHRRRQALVLDPPSATSR